MLSETLTLSVDETGTSTFVSRPMTRYQEYLNRSVYISAAHTPASRDTLGFYRTEPKANGNFRGVLKSSFKFTKDITVEGIDGSDIVAPLIVEVNFSFPMGSTSAQMLERRKSAAGLLGHTDISDLTDLLMI